MVPPIVMLDVMVSERGRSSKGQHDISSGEASHLFESYNCHLAVLDTRWQGASFQRQGSQQDEGHSRAGMNTQTCLGAASSDLNP